MNLLEEIPYKIPIQSILLERGLIYLIDKIDIGALHIVCDENTIDFISSKYDKTILPAHQKPELAKSKELAQIECDCFVAVGSGTINDLVKYAAFLAGKPYIIFSTAPSMNGYASANASLLQDGYKKTFSANPPHSIYLDLEILENSPKRLINSGIGDSICRVTCQADNLLASLATGAEYYQDYFNFMRKYEDAIFEDISALTKTLIFSGVAMLLAGSSAPASQAEHMLAHYMELMQPSHKHNFHGEDISVTTITMAKLQQELLQNEIIISEMDIDEEAIHEHFGAKLSPYFIEQVRKKYTTLKPQIISPKEFEIPDYQKIESQLKAIGAPIKAQELGWQTDTYKKALTHTKLTRDRFTFLDLI